MTLCLVNHDINDHLVFVLVCTEWLIVCPAINNPASCEIRALIRYLHAKTWMTRKSVVDYELFTAKKELLENGVECSKIGEQIFTMKREMVGRPSVVSDYLVQSVDQKICENRRFKTSEFPCEFPQISRTVLYEIITVRAGYHTLSARLVQKCSRVRIKRRERLRLWFF
jgi:hypothetical protein